MIFELRLHMQKENLLRYRNNLLDIRAIADTKWLLL
jgi:hypothetical protein